MQPTFCNCGSRLELIEEDDRQEWYKAIYHCLECNLFYEHRIERDQNGCVVHESLTEVINES